MIDPHPMLPAAEGWRAPVLVPHTDDPVQLAYTERNGPGVFFVLAHWVSSNPKGWFRSSFDHLGNRISVPLPGMPRFVAWRPLWPADRAAEAEAHDARVRSLHEALNNEIDRRRAAEADAGRLRDLVQIAEAAFHRYATSHAAKGTRDGEVKAAANAELARQMRAALDPAP